MALSPYYYGPQRRAISGTPYGPYYGARYMGGRGQADTQVGTQAGITELSEKYAAEPAISTPSPTPAISGEYGSQGEMTGKPSNLPGTAADVTPREARDMLLWGAGLRSTPPKGSPQPTGAYKTAGQIGKVAASALTGIPFMGAIYNQAKLFADTLISKAFPNLYSPESLTTTAEALRGAKASAEYSSMGMFGAEVSVTAAEAARGADQSAAYSSMGYFGGTDIGTDVGPGGGGEVGGGYGGGGYGGEASGEGGPL